MTPLVVNECADLGLDGTFLPILVRHIDDLYLTHSANEISSLMVLPDNSTRDCNYVRVANIADSQLKNYYSRLDTAVNKMGHVICGRTKSDSHGKDKAILTCGVEWIFAELVTDAVNNSCRMQEVFNSYIPDYNGQSIFNQAETTISRNFFRIYADSHTASEEDIRRDTDNFRAGLALQFLRNSLVKHGVTSNINRADWIVNDIRRDYPRANFKHPIEPLSVEEIESRFLAMEPNDTKAQMARFIATLDPLEEFLSE